MLLRLQDPELAAAIEASLMLGLQFAPQAEHGSWFVSVKSNDVMCSRGCIVCGFKLCLCVVVTLLERDERDAPTNQGTTLAALAAFQHDITASYE